MINLIIALIGLYTGFSLALTANKTLVLPLNKWSSQRVISIAMGQVIEEMGLQVEYRDIDATSQWGALGRGVVHFQIEVWQPSLAQPYEQMVKTGHIVELGNHLAKGKEEWWYPKYVEKECPELPDWRALNKCWRLFAKQSGSKKGTYLGGPWDYSDGDIIRALNLNYTIERLPDSTAIWKELARASKNETPILLLNWSPNWTDRHIEGSFIEFPAYTEECEQDPSWGINKLLANDCGNPSQSWLKKAAWSGLERHAPCVFQMIKNIELTHDMIVEAASLLVFHKLSEDGAARKWREIYADKIKAWLPKHCR